MSEQKTGTPGQPSEADLAKARAGEADKSSHDHKSREKAGSDEGAGGGAKQEEKH